MNADLFVDWKFFKTVEAVSCLDAVCSHQFHNGDGINRVYTAMDRERGFAFSQTYRKLPEKKCTHGGMFKHERGQKNPDPLPSFSDLEKLIPLCLSSPCDKSHCPRCGGHSYAESPTQLCAACLS